jgi:hypothetical protein
VRIDVTMKNRSHFPKIKYKQILTQKLSTK